MKTAMLVVATICMIAAYLIVYTLTIAEIASIYRDTALAETMRK